MGVLKYLYNAHGIDVKLKIRLPKPYWALFVTALFECWHRGCLRRGDRKVWGLVPLYIIWCIRERGIVDLLRENNAPFQP